MLHSLGLKNFKSYRDAHLPLADLTVLIGANASGKSNLIEAAQLLSWLAQGRRLGDFLLSVKEGELAIRGTPSTLVPEGARAFTVRCEIGDADGDLLEFLMTIEVDAQGARIVDERLWKGADPPLYSVMSRASAGRSDLEVAYNNFLKGGTKPHIGCIDQQAVFTQLQTPARFGEKHRKSQVEIPRASTVLRETLENTLFLDAIPARMRGLSFPAERKLHGDASNISAVLHHLCVAKGQADAVLTFVRDLPEQDIRRIEFLEGPRGDVLLSLVETFGGEERAYDAGLLSDGTLRVLAVAAALLSVPEGSTVSIEEIDNGVHPSRSQQLLANILRCAKNRRLRVLLTTHNPALLDAIPPEAIPNVVFCYRHPDGGDSRLVRLADLDDYSALVAQGPIGRLVTQRIVDRFVKHPPSSAVKDERAKRTLELLKGGRKAGA